MTHTLFFVFIWTILAIVIGFAIYSKISRNQYNRSIEQDAKAQKALGFQNSTPRSFYFEGKGFLAPKELGSGYVSWAIKGATDAIKRLAQDQSALCKLISAKPMSAQLLLVSLQVAALYVYAARTLVVPRDVLDELCIGISSGFTLLSAATNAPINIQFLEQHFRTYAQSVHEELNADPVDPTSLTLHFGSTATLVAKEIATQYGALEQYEQNRAEAIPFEILISLLWHSSMKSMKDLGLRFVP